MKSAVAALNLGQDILTRLDAIAAAERRSRSNQARIFLETAMNADEALRQQFSQVTSGGAAIQRGAGDDSRAILPANVSGRGAARAGLPRQGEAVDDLCYVASYPASPSNFYDDYFEMPGRSDTRSAAGGVSVQSCGDAERQEVVALPGETGAAEATVFAGNTSPAPAYFFPETQGKSKMNVNADPHAQLKADALRTAADGIASRLYPKKPIEKLKDSST